MTTRFLRRFGMGAVITLTPILASACSNSAFVQTRQGRFRQGDDRLVFVGVNFWQGMHMAMEKPWGDRARLAGELDHLQSLGVTNLRILAAAEGPDDQPYRIGPALMTAPGVYDPRVVDGLDYLLAEIARRDMHAVVVLTNFWEWSGGMAQYVAWATGTPIPYPQEHDWRVFCDYATRFYENPDCQRWYRDHLKTIITRVNPYTQRAYRDEPAIFAWELANEPRYYPIDWIEQSAAYIKSLDANHMVTTGSEGSIGGPFAATHQSKYIDYTTIHIWPQNWDWIDPQEPDTLGGGLARALGYLNEHIALSAGMGKPLVVEEFGMARDSATRGDIYDPQSSTSWRDAFFAAVYATIEASAERGGPAAGSNIWVWSGAAGPGDHWIGDPPHERAGWYSVYATDESTLDLITSHAERINSSAARATAMPAAQR